ncbi:hypothetical protein AAFF_G00056840 [Aldrovandia affinis]|uniref:Uncharacterized protein n=1 Tax=Aldrovandia affinis TaxID=143900 RepID=A0AAD7S0M5_9TELE|nr:hypothetical protein AAFF_G00056840 [Aldrovandia affinis]
MPHYLNIYGGQDNVPHYLIPRDPQDLTSMPDSLDSSLSEQMNVSWEMRCAPFPLPASRQRAAEKPLGCRGNGGTSLVDFSREIHHGFPVTLSICGRAASAGLMNTSELKQS